MVSPIPVRIIDPLHDPDWDNHVQSFENASFFHSSAWARTLVSTYGFRPIYHVAPDVAVPLMEVNSRITGRRAVSLPFTDECPLLYRNAHDLPETIANIIDAGRSRGWRYVEFRSNKGHTGSPSPSASYLTHTIGLRAADEDGMLGQLRPPVRQSIRKAERSGVEVSSCRDLSSVRDFYRLNSLTRREHGLPPQPWAFFRNLHDHVLAHGQGRVVLARLRGTPIAGAVFLHSGRQALYKYGASDRRFQTFRPNNLVMWHAIGNYAREGAETLSLGRTRRENEGLRRFKLGCGAEESELHYLKYSLEQNKFVTDRDHVAGWHNAVFRHLPLPCLSLIGRLLYKHMA